MIFGTVLMLEHSRCSNHFIDPWPFAISVKVWWNWTEIGSKIHQIWSRLQWRTGTCSKGRLFLEALGRFRGVPAVRFQKLCRWSVANLSRICRQGKELGLRLLREVISKAEMSRRCRDLENLCVKLHCQLISSMSLLYEIPSEFSSCSKSDSSIYIYIITYIYIYIYIHKNE